MPFECREKDVRRAKKTRAVHISDSVDIQTTPSLNRTKDSQKIVHAKWQVL
jgi:hypothetical protein